MPLPWWYHFLDAHTIHNDIYDAFVEQRSDTASLEQQLKTLQRQVQDLQLHVAGLEALLASHGIKPPATEETTATSRSTAEPVLFPSRTEEPVSCPVCGRRQRGNRDCCYSCGVKFQYEDE